MHLVPELSLRPNSPLFAAFPACLSAALGLSTLAASSSAATVVLGDISALPGCVDTCHGQITPYFSLGAESWKMSTRMAVPASAGTGVLPSGRVIF